MEPQIHLFDYSLPQVDTVVILGAGPSLNEYIDTINDIKDKVIIGSNYNFPISSDFTLFTGPGTFKHSVREITSPNIIISQLVLSRRKRIIDSMTEKQFYVMQNIESKKVYYKEIEIKISKEGVFGHSFANSGFTSILVSHFFRPKKVILTGFDGPDLRSDGYYQTHFNGKDRKWSDPAHGIMKSDFALRQNFLRLILEFLRGKNIDIQILGEFWGINR